VEELAALSDGLDGRARRSAVVAAEGFYVSIKAKRIKKTASAF
jgi:hypothetical protein